MVAIGHSFSARILFGSVAPILLHNLQMSHPGVRGGRYSELRGPVDLTILLNPAFEASRYSTFDTSKRWQENFSPTQQPMLIAVSTTNDYATKFAFPIGQAISGRWNQRERTTLGNYVDYVTHNLTSTDQPGDKAGNRHWYDEFCEGELCLSRSVTDFQAGNPFLVARTDSSVLDGHNGIWTPSFQEWMVAFIRRTELEKRKQGTTNAARHD